MKIIELLKTTSTQDEIKKYIGEELPVAVFAREQSFGRGTKGRVFISDKGGVYASFMVGWENLYAEQAFSVVKRFSLAVVKTLEELGLSPKIKWPNDIYVSDKKICGMLIENHVENGLIDYSIAGIGINVNNEISETIKDVATSVANESKKRFDERDVFLSLAKNVLRKYPEGEYEKYSCVLGRKIKVLTKDGEYFAVADGILSDGRLKLDSGKTLSAEEISIKF